jgi:hypothetical protein
MIEAVLICIARSPTILSTVFLLLAVCLLSLFFRSQEHVNAPFIGPLSAGSSKTKPKTPQELLEEGCMKVRQLAAPLHVHGLTSIPLVQK